MTFPDRDPCQKSVGIICVGLFLSSLFYSISLHICSFVKYFKIGKSKAFGCFFLSKAVLALQSPMWFHVNFIVVRGDVGKSLH